jgi:hypothetical protein
MTRRAARIDTNQPEIFALWRSLGVLVTDTSRFGEGFPDCLLAYRGRLLLAEIKHGNNGLNGRQDIFHRQHEAHGVIIPVIRSESEALALIGARRCA